MRSERQRVGLHVLPELNGTFGNPKTGNQVGNGGVTLNNIQSVYWSGTEFDTNVAWDLFFALGVQDNTVEFNSGYGWAVRPGDSVGVPEPASVVLLGLGLLGCDWHGGVGVGDLVIRVIG